MLLTITVLWLLLQQTGCLQSPFNVDTQFPIPLPTPGIDKKVHDHNQDFPSLFSISLAVTEINQTFHNVFIGSPYLKSVPSFISGGVFRCAINLNLGVKLSCNEIDFHNVNFHGNGFPFEPRNKSLLGFSLLRTSSAVIACAPNWVSGDLTPEGMCFSLNPTSSLPMVAFKNPTKIPVRANRPYESHTLFGFSLDYNPFNDEIVLGLPGYIDFTGSISVVNRDLDVFKFRDAHAQSNSYSGFSVAWYTFDAMMAIAVGTPKYSKFNGKVDLIDMESHAVLYTLFSKNDTQGEFFGYSLLVTDIGSDLKGDIFVGAPLYSAQGKREIGRVYLFQSVVEMMHRRMIPQLIMPKVSKSGARFGSNIATIDVDMDKFLDIIISAPFEPNPDGTSGAIYLYYGTRTGIDLLSEQRIGAEQLAMKNVLGFGYSVWSKSDFDNNGYNDLVIGSLISEKVFIMRSIPIVNFNLTLTFDRKGINLTDHSECATQNSCFRVNYCFHISSPTNLVDDLTFQVNFTISDRKLRLKENRVITGKQSSIVKIKDKETCFQGLNAFYVDVKKKEFIYDIITPIEVQMSAVLQKPDYSFEQFCALCPIANPVNVYNEIGFEHGCANKQCLANLDLKVDFRYGPNPIDDVIVEGQYSSLDVTIKVINSGEPSIDTIVTMLMKPKIITLLDNSDSFRCSNNQQKSGYICDINKLLQKDQKEELILRIDLSKIDIQSLTMNFALTSSSLISSDSRTTFAKTVQIIKEVSFNVIGTPQYNYSFLDQSPNVIFPISIVVEKDGPSMVNTTYLEFYLPNQLVELEQSSKYRCNRQIRRSLFYPKAVNETLNLICSEVKHLCTKYRCNLNRFESGSHRTNFDLTLIFYPTKLPKKLQYNTALMEVQMDVLTEDVFLKANTTQAYIDTMFYFERQVSILKSRSRRLIMFGGVGIGLLILLLTIIILLKRKKRDELLRVKQRMSMNPNLIQFQVDDDDEDDDESPDPR